MSNLRTGVDAFFEPRSVALVGISSRPDSYTANALRYLLDGFEGEIYPINPNRDEIGGLRCFPSMRAVGHPIDLVLCMVPAANVCSIVEEAAEVGARGVSIFSAGFAEEGAEGRARQHELVDIVQRTGIRILGPNCQGSVDFHAPVKATFSRALDHLPSDPGAIAYLGQSGAIGGSFLNLAQERGVGLSLWASTGNQADVDVLDLAEYAIQHDATQVLALYLENISDGWRLNQVLCSAASGGKRVVILKVGRTVEGMAASASHTGSLMSAGTDFDTIAATSGAVLVDDVDELLDVACALAQWSVAHQGRLGVITTSGGAGILVADQAPAFGLSVPPLGLPTQARLAALLPDFASTRNPVDVTYQFFAREEPFVDKPDGRSPLHDVVDVLADDAEIDAIVVIITMVVGRLANGLVEDVAALSARCPKPIHFVWMAGLDLTADARNTARRNGLTCFSAIRPALRVAGSLLDGGVPRLLARPEGSERNISGSLDDASLPATEFEAGQFLDALGVPRPAGDLAHSPQDARRVAESLATGLVVMKAQSPQLKHKTEVGGVRIGVSAEDAGEVYSALEESARSVVGELDGVLVQEMIDPGIELLVSVAWPDVSWPPLITVGAGGTTAEIWRDTVHIAAPADEADIAERLRSLRQWPLLKGWRGEEPADVDAVVDAVQALTGAVITAGGRIREIEVNPLIVHGQGKGVCAVDVLVSGATSQLTEVERR